MTENPLLLALPRVNLAMENLFVHGDGKTEIEVDDPSFPGGVRRGDFFVSLEPELVEVLPDSTLSPGEFLLALGVPEEKAAAYERSLLGPSFDKGEGPVFSWQDENFSLKVAHGSTNERALLLTELAVKGFDDPQVREAYQVELAKLVRSPLTYESEADFLIEEDCVASGDTIVGVLTLIGKKALGGKKIRVDVAVATTQGIMVLREFAHQNDLQLEINAGHLAYGLSAGEKHEGVRLHANYITYPDKVLTQLAPKTRERLEQYRAEDGNIYVVGDMGDAAMSLPESFDERLPWNRFRSDDHGDRLATEARPRLEVDPQLPTVMFFANGGYLMKALRRHHLGEAAANQVVFSAKRVWSSVDSLGYGVLVYGVPRKLVGILDFEETNGER